MIKRVFAVLLASIMLLVSLPAAAKPDQEIDTETNTTSMVSQTEPTKDFVPRLSMTPETAPAYYTTLNYFYNIGYGMPNCTCYAYGRAYEILGHAPNLCTTPGHASAKYWWDYNIDNNCYPYGRTPALGAVVCWTNSGSGHVAVVEQIDGDYIITSESAWGGQYFFTTRRSMSGLLNNSEFQGFIYIYNSPVNPPAMPTVTTDSTLYCVGQTVSITWNPVSDNQFYWINVYRNGTLIVDQNMGTNTAYYLSNAAVGNYTVFLSANNSAGTSGSSHCYFTVVDTPPEAPSATASADYYRTGDTVTISWNSVPTTRYYTYYLSEYPFAYAYQTNVQSDSITSTSISFNGLPNGKYAFFVHAVNEVGYSGQSNWVYFDVFDYDYTPVSIWMYNGHIYSVYDANTSWDFANDFCNKAGGNLVTITSAEENEFVSGLIANGSLDAYWIGARNDSTGTWNSVGNPFIWVTGEPFSYSNWYPGEPNSMGEDASREHFAEIRKSYNNRWNDVSCARRSDRGFIMETDVSEWAAAASAIYGKSKYLLFDNACSWWEAKTFCEANGEHMAIISSSTEDTVIWDLINNGNLPWYYMGARATNGVWSWLDGTTVPLSGSYANWSETDGTVVTGPTGWGNYLMKYKNYGTWIGLQNFYDPYYSPRIGFVMEIDNAVNTLHFNANGGVVSIESKTIVFGDTYGTLPTPERNGYLFDGWYTLPQGGERIEESSIVTVKADQTLYAHWIEAQTILLGDADNNGTVDSVDALLILRYALGIVDSLPSIENADVTGDGAVDSVDALMVLRHALGIITL